MILSSTGPRPMPQQPADPMGDDSPLLDSDSVDSSISEDASDRCASQMTYIVGNHNTCNVTIPVNQPVPVDGKPAAQHKLLNFEIKVSVQGKYGLHLKIDCEGQRLVDREVGNEMTNTSCFTMLANYFHKKYLRLRGVRRGCIILDLSPESPEALKLLLKDVRYGDFNNLLAGVLQKKKIFDIIAGDELNVKVEIVVAESLLRDSGLSASDLEPFSRSCTITREQTDGDGRCTGAVGMDASDNTGSSIQTESAIEAMVHLITIGRTRVGKSSVDNIITQSNNFLSTFSAVPVTKDCQTDRFIRNRVLYNISDTPGIDSHQDKPSNLSAAIKIGALVKSQLGRTFFLMTFRLGEKKEDVIALKYFKTLLGPLFTKSCIVVFTGKESLDYEGLNLDEYIQTDPALVQLKEDVDNRMVTVSKRASLEEQEEFIDQLLAHVNSLQQQGSSYTWTMLEHALQAEDERQRLATQEKASQELREREAIEDIVMQNLRLDMRRQLDLHDIQDTSTVDQRRPGMRRPVGSEITDENLIPSQKKPRTEILP